MRIELEDLTLTDKHPDGDNLNNEHVGLEFDGVKTSANIDQLIKALELMKERK